MTKNKLLSNYFNHLSFLHSWRPYQAKVIECFSKHIADNHFHIVAPPGSGKTVLGLEIIRQINKKTLVLAPTLTIRNQWENRLQHFFTKDKLFQKFSFDIKNPSDITFSTYQGLHAFFKTFKNENDYFQFFIDEKIEVLVLDEAHHLKNEWWKCLFNLKEKHTQTIVALTATPPYDSENNEIDKYFKLCGEIDDEIAVPDLVKARNLCPHQDLVYLSKPEDIEINFIANFRLKISEFTENLLKNSEFISFLKQHRFYSKTTTHLEEIYKFSYFFSALLIFLNEAKQEIPIEKLHVLGFENNEEIEFPELNYKWLTALFQFLLVTDRENLTEQEKYLLSIEKELRKLSVFSKNNIDFVGDNLLYKNLSNSPSKLKSIVTIVNNEYNTLQNELSCVILSDYIRKEYLNTNDFDVKSIKKMGVVPIFHYLRTGVLHKKHLAVLSGSLVIIHSTVLAKIDLFCKQENYTFSPLISDSEFVIVSQKGSQKNLLTNLITQLFEGGYIKILIGTKSLLGEGWDAPSINSLILGSVVGSFVSSNQMRGRAIRIDTNYPNKVGIIWHLACIDTSDELGGRDFNILTRRFNAFLGVSNNENPIISNGIERLGLPQNITPENISIINQKSMAIANNRSNIANNWKKAIIKGSKMGKEIRLFHQNDKKFIHQKSVYYTDIVKFATLEIFIGLSFFLPKFLIQNFNVILSKGISYFLFTLSAGLLTAFGIKTYKAIQLYFYFGLIHKKIDKMGNVIIHSMFKINLLTTPINKIQINTQLLPKGDVICSITGATRLESNLFSEALNELLLPIENPKYLLIKTNRFKKFFDVQNFFPIPELFGVNKKSAEIFHLFWQQYIGKSELLYTRNSKGRKLLLKARLFHIHNAHKKITKKNIVWK